LAGIDVLDRSSVDPDTRSEDQAVELDLAAAASHCDVRVIGRWIDYN
jgi:hypothetical protein